LKIPFTILPQYIEKYGLENLEISISAIEEITKRNTGEYAIRPFIRKYPEEVLAVMKKWAHIGKLSFETIGKRRTKTQTSLGFKIGHLY
jgi:3-methyladenine DNA glycosylase AlkC